MFAIFMDYVVYPIAWLFSPRLREHGRNVRIQNDHLDGKVHAVADPTCDYCVARSDDLRRHRGLTPDVDPRVLP